MEHRNLRELFIRNAFIVQYCCLGVFFKSTPGNCHQFGFPICAAFLLNRPDPSRDSRIRSIHSPKGFKSFWIVSQGLVAVSHQHQVFRAGVFSLFHPSAQIKQCSLIVSGIIAFTGFLRVFSGLGFPVITKQKNRHHCEKNKQHRNKDQIPLILAARSILPVHLFLHTVRPFPSS